MTDVAPRRRSPGMSKPRILAAARALVEADGIEALSMRKLAAELGVAPTAIYWHVGGRDDLLAELAEHLLGELTEVEAVGTTPAERIGSVARGMRRQIRAHPHLVELLTELGRGPALSFPVQVAVAREVTAAGLEGAAAAEAVRSVLYLVGAFIVLEQAMDEEGIDTAVDLWRDSRDPGVPAALRRRLARRVGVGDVFEPTLAALLRGLFPPD
jgi:TetR/AcrR family transcriptional regulator, tetracycline repressor protein